MGVYSISPYVWRFGSLAGLQILYAYSHSGLYPRRSSGWQEKSKHDHEELFLTKPRVYQILKGELCQEIRTKRCVPRHRP